jgi:cell division septal protein FtsQ
MSARGRSSRDRFARRAWARRWATVRRIAVAVALLGLFAGAGWLVFVSKVLAVQQVQVSGLRTLSPDRVTAAAAVPLGAPLARVDVDAVQARVERVPVVDGADISRSWPHTVTIEVTERTPVAVLRRHGRLRLVDAEGVLFRTVAEPPARLPVMTAGGAAIADAAAVAAALPPRLGARVTHVRAPTMDSIELELRDGRTVVWGSAERSRLKVRVVGALLRRRASVYDVSVPGAPTLEVG